MKNIQEIRRELWHSLDMANVKVWLFWTVVMAAIECLMAFLATGGLTAGENAAVLVMMLAISILPIWAFCIWRTFRIFQAAESYIFCTTKLSNPMGGRLRDSIKFRVVLEDADGCKFVADTHSIFQTHTGFGGFGLEDYVNQQVTIAYNEETENVVVIG